MTNAAAKEMRVGLILLLLCLILLSAAATFAQTTTVTLQVTDTPDNQTWNNGTYQTKVIPLSGSQPNAFTRIDTGVVITSANQPSGALSATGGASFSLISNSNIGPGQTQWQITVCPQGASVGCFIANVVIAGATQTVTLTPPSIRINLTTAVPPVVAYATGEIAQASLGASFFLVGAGPQTCMAVTGTSCTSWTSGGNPSSAGLVDPATPSTYGYAGAGVKPVKYVAGDGSTTSGQNTFSSANQNCAASDAGLVLLAVNINNVGYGSAFSNYLFGSTAGFIATVSSCSGNSWVLNANANFTTGGNAVWALGPDSGAAFKAAYAFIFTNANVPGSGLALPCNGPYLITVAPFVPPTAFNQFLQNGDIYGCPQSRTMFIIHPNAATANGAIVSGSDAYFFAAAQQGSLTSPPGSFIPTGGSTFVSAQHILLTSLAGLLPGIASKSMDGFNNFNVGNDINVFALSASSNNTTTWNVWKGSNGEQRLSNFNFQDATNQGPTFNINNWTGISMGGQGTLGVRDMICAFQGWNPCISSGPTGTGITNLQGLYFTGASPSSILVNNAMTLTGSSITGGGGPVIDDNNVATTMYVFGNVLGTQGTNQNIFHLGNASTQLDISGTNLIPTSTGGLAVTGSGQVINRVGMTWTLSGTAGGIGSGIRYVADGHSAKGACTGVATASSTLGLYPLSGGSGATTCTVTTPNVSPAMVSGTRTLTNLIVTATTGGVNASSGVVTVLKNGSATTITCTLGTGTSCVDNTHQVAAVDGDLISIQFTTQAADTLAGVKAIVGWD